MLRLEGIQLSEKKSVSQNIIEAASTFWSRRRLDIVKYIQTYYCYEA